MTVTPAAPIGTRADLLRWRRRSRLIGALRKVLPGAIALLILSLVGQVLWTSLTAKKSEARETPVAIRMLNPRFFGRDDQGRSFMIGARQASRDDRNLQRVTLDQPTVALGLDTPTPSRVSALSGVYTEGDRMLRLTGQVRIEDGAGYRFATEQALVDTRAGTVTGDMAMIGEGPVGAVTSKSYSVFDKGDRMVFKGGVSARINRD
jgi:lipopolysaccharide export system protein LptC